MNKKTPNYFNNTEVKNLKNKAIKGAGVSIGAQVLSFFIRTTGIIILARLLEPRDFGLVTMVATIYFLLMNFGANGFTEYIIQKKEIDHTEISTIFWLHALISFIITIGFISSAPIIAMFYKEPEINAITFVMSLGIMMSMLSTYNLAILKRKMNFGTIALFRIITTFLSVFFAIIMALNGFGYWAVVTRQLAETAVMGILAFIL